MNRCKYGSQHPDGLCNGCRADELEAVVTLYAHHHSSCQHATEMKCECGLIQGLVYVGIDIGETKLRRAQFENEASGPGRAYVIADALDASP